MQKGFTLIEILAAAVVVVIVSIGTLAVIETGAKILTEARLKTEAALLAESTLEEIFVRAKTETGYDALSDADISVPAAFILANRIITAAYDIVDVPGFELKKATVTITWEKGGLSEPEKSLNFETLIFNPAYIE